MQANADAKSTPDYRRGMKLFVMMMAVAACGGEETQEAPTKPAAPYVGPPKTQAQVDAEAKAAADAAKPKEPTYADVTASNFGSEAENKIAAERIPAAMKAVYELCNETVWEWRAGAKLDGTAVVAAKGRKFGQLVNVSVDFKDKSVTSGHVLHYQVGFDAKGAPTTIRAEKEVSAEFCALKKEGVAYPLKNTPRSTGAEQMDQAMRRKGQADAAGAMKRRAHLAGLSKMIRERDGGDGFEARGSDDTDAHYLGMCTQSILDDLAARLRGSFKSLGFRRMTCDGGISASL